MRDLHHSSSVSDGCRTDVLAGPAPKNGCAQSIFAVVLGNTPSSSTTTIYVAFAPVLARAFFPMRDL
jgi:hypothetical protein